MNHTRSSFNVLGLLMVGLTEGSRFGFLAFKHQSDAISAHDQFDAVDRTLRQLLAQVKRPSEKELIAPLIEDLPQERAARREIPVKPIEPPSRPTTRRSRPLRIGKYLTRPCTSRSAVTAILRSCAARGSQ